MLIVGVASLVLVAALRVNATTPFSRRLRFWMILACAVEIAAFVLVRQGLHTVLFYNLYWPMEFGLLLFLGSTIAPQARLFIAALAVPFGAIWCWYALHLDLRTQLTSVSIITGALMLAGLYLYLLWHVAGTRPGRLRDIPEFWLCLAVLTYYGSSGPLIGSINYFMRVDFHLAETLSSISQLFCIVKFVLMGLACLRLRHPAAVPIHEPG